MPIETHIDRAQERVQAEQDAVDAKIEAFDSFIHRVDKISPQTISPPTTGATAAAGTQLQGGTSGTDRCRKVRTAFTETVRPHSITDTDESEPLLETIHQELSESIAVALAPTTDTSFTPAIQQAVLVEADTRRTETTALHRALGREEAILERAAATVNTINRWLTDADETPLSDLGFEPLQDRHETIATHREECAELACDRQAFLQKATNHTAEAGIRHQSLIPYLYEDFPINHPILSTAVRLDGTCAECQRAVRDHLVRRV